jgi:hypothetical protein
MALAGLGVGVVVGAHPSVAWRTRCAAPSTGPWSGGCTPEACQAPSPVSSSCGSSTTAPFSAPACGARGRPASRRGGAARQGVRTSPGGPARPPPRHGCPHAPHQPSRRGRWAFGDLRWDVAASVLVGSIPRVLAGARLSTRAPGSVIRAGLVVVLLAQRPEAAGPAQPGDRCSRLGRSRVARRGQFAGEVIRRSWQA